MVEAALRPVDDRAVGEQRGEAAVHGGDDGAAATHVEVGLLLPGEAGLREVLGGGAAAHGDVALLAVLLFQPAIRLPNGLFQGLRKLSAEDRAANALADRLQPGDISDVEISELLADEGLEPGRGHERAVRGGRRREPVRNAHAARHERATQLAERGVLASDSRHVREPDVVEPEHLCIGHVAAPARESFIEPTAAATEAKSGKPAKRCRAYRFTAGRDVGETLPSDSVECGHREHPARNPLPAACDRVREECMFEDNRGSTGSDGGNREATSLVVEAARPETQNGEGAGDAVVRVGDRTLERIDAYRWRLPRTGGMRVEGLIYAARRMLDDIAQDRAVEQVANVATLPGIVGRSIAMPDIHLGYGFPIGGVAAFDPEQGGVVSPAGVGYDINCGVRLLRSDLPADDARPRMAALMTQIMRDVPAGVGSQYKDRVLGEADLRAVLEQGSAWLLAQGVATEDDLERTEAGGAMPGADPDAVSGRALERGRPQLGTVGSGNHFIEVGFVDEVYDATTATRFGLRPGHVTVLIHSGSRGLGHQVCDDFLGVMLDSAARNQIALPDRQLACAPLDSPEARRYMGAMTAAANFAFANRQMMAHRVRLSFARIFGRTWQDLGLNMVYDVAHNMAKWERHEVDGRERRLCVHRKGATRAFPPGHPDVPAAYRDVGQPMLIPGDMVRYSYVLAGTAAAFRETFGSACHGAGRRMSRHSAKASVRGRSLRNEFRELGIEVRASSYATIAEEIPEAYKDVAEVVDVVHGAGIGRRIARLKPLGVLKG